MNAIVDQIAENRREFVPEAVVRTAEPKPILIIS